MKFSVPIYILKQRAKVFARNNRIPLHDALDRIAKEQGFGSWSLLAAKWNADNANASLLSQLRRSELVLLAARPGQGKTLLSLRLAAEWMARAGHAAIFTLEFTRADVLRCFGMIGRDVEAFADLLAIDDSDDVSADYIVGKLKSAPSNLLIVIDYLQLLDQRRENPSLADQVTGLRDFARQHQAIIVCLSQVHRSYDPVTKPLPTLNDIRLPNPVDLKLFDKACFVGRRKVQIGSVG